MARRPAQGRITIMNDFDALLKPIRHKEHPDYGTPSWDGQTRTVTVTVQFEENGVKEADDASP